jgi:hypothetical protein
MSCDAAQQYNIDLLSRAAVDVMTRFSRHCASTLHKLPQLSVLHCQEDSGDRMCMHLKHLKRSIVPSSSTCLLAARKRCTSLR